MDLFMCLWNEFNTLLNDNLIYLFNYVHGLN